MLKVFEITLRSLIFIFFEVFFRYFFAKWSNFLKYVIKIFQFPTSSKFGLKKFSPFCRKISKCNLLQLFNLLKMLHFWLMAFVFSVLLLVEVHLNLVFFLQNLSLLIYTVRQVQYIHFRISLCFFALSFFHPLFFLLLIRSLVNCGNFVFSSLLFIHAHRNKPTTIVCKFKV